MREFVKNILFLMAYEAAIFGCFLLCELFHSPWAMLSVIVVAVVATRYVFGIEEENKKGM